MPERFPDVPRGTFARARRGTIDRRDTGDFARVEPAHATSGVEGKFVNKGGRRGKKKPLPRRSPRVFSPIKTDQRFAPACPSASLFSIFYPLASRLSVPLAQFSLRLPRHGSFPSVLLPPSVSLRTVRRRARVSPFRLRPVPRTSTQILSLLIPLAGRLLTCSLDWSATKNTGAPRSTWVSVSFQNTTALTATAHSTA